MGCGTGGVWIVFGICFCMTSRRRVQLKFKFPVVDCAVPVPAAVLVVDPTVLPKGRPLLSVRKRRIVFKERCGRVTKNSS